MNQRKKIIDGWVIANIFVIIILIAINIPYTTTEPYTDKEYYTEQEPYTTTETHYEIEPYIENAMLNISTKLDWNVNYRSYDGVFDFKATLKNTGNVGGEFWVTFHVESTHGSNEFTTNKTYLKPNESYQIKQTFGGLFSYATYKVYQPTKEITAYRYVPKERTVTAYRNVEKSREIIKSKEIKGSLLQRILDKTEIKIMSKSNKSENSVQQTGDEKR